MSNSMDRTEVDMTKQNTLIHHQPINTGRQIELDLARGLAVLFMIAIHIVEMYATPQVAGSAGGMIILFLGGPPAAPVFMLVMGVGLVYSSKNQPAIFIKRGLLIVLLGYLLNFLRATAPYLLGWLMSQDTEYLTKGLVELSTVDILQFAGLALIILGLLKSLRLNPWFILLIAAGLSVLNLFLVNIKIEQPLAAAVTGLFWGSNPNSHFPLLSWLIYPAVGMVFAHMLIRCTDKRRFYLRTGIIALSILVIVVVAAILFNINIDTGLANEYHYYHQTLPTQLTIALFVLVWVTLFYFISIPLKGLLKQVVDRWSRNVTEIYFIHWVLLGWLAVSLPMQGLGWAALGILFVIVTAFSDFAAWFYVSRKMKRKEKGSRTKRS